MSTEETKIDSLKQQIVLDQVEATKMQEEEYDDDEDEGFTFQQQRGVTIIHKKSDEVEKYFENMVETTMKEQGISFGRALLLLSRNSYDQNRVQIGDESLIDLIYPTPAKDIEDMANLKTCLLCFDDLTESNQYALPCDHFFCRDCFQQYIQEIFNEGQFCIFKTCPLDRCLERVGLKEFQTFLDDDKFNLYKKFLLKDALGNSEVVIACPQPSCPYVQMSSKNEMIKLDQQNIICECKYEYCNQCKEIGHYPCNCTDFRKWISRLESSEKSDLNDEWLIMNTKPCPKCKTLIEKNQGCMHMTCKQCSNHFCWICLNDWKGHNDYYKCSKFDQEKLDTMQREKIELSHFKFHNGQYIHHLSNISVVQKETASIIESINSINSKLISQNQKIIDIDQIVKYCEQILRGRKYMPFFYSKGFFIQEKPKLKFFNELIEDYVRIIEDFNQGLENLKDIIDTQSNDQDGKIILKKSFYQFKDNLSKKLGSCQRYIDQKLIQFTEDLDQFENIANQKLKVLPVKSVDIFKKKQEKHVKQYQEHLQKQQQNIKQAVAAAAPVEKQKSEEIMEVQQQPANSLQSELSKKRKVQTLFKESEIEFQQQNVLFGDSSKKHVKFNDKIEEVKSTVKRDSNNMESNLSNSQSVLLYRCLSENAPLTCIDCGEHPATNEYGVCDSCFDSLSG